ncbi:MAG: Re/Si-specific NAD(P)(+) transhydrogenase subunit alpha [Candidatus Dasytiphilus stammeri]
MKIGVPKERIINELRVAATPNTVKEIIKLGFIVLVESGAGQTASFTDVDFSEAGAIITDCTEVWQSDVVIKINPPTVDEISLMHENIILISFIWPAQNIKILEQIAAIGQINVISMDTVPRLSRAQSIDALTSMSNIAGYRAIIEAAYEYGKFFHGQMTVAGNIWPAKVMIIGAGVAGLSAIGIARSLGAMVWAFDTRPEVQEQVESMGAKFIQLDLKGINDIPKKNKEATSDFLIKKERDFFTNQIKEFDIIVTTAMITGESAPIIITRKMVDNMKPGSVIVDLAAQTGGNCELTVVDKLIITNKGVKIIGYTDLPSRLPSQSSQLYSTNIVNLLKILCQNKKGEIFIDLDDIIIRNLTIIFEGKIIWPAPPMQIIATGSESKMAAQHSIIKKEEFPVADKKSSSKWHKYIYLFLGIIPFGWLSTTVPAEILSHFKIFILACIVGYYVVWNVSDNLHTPLISVTNAISGIIIVGSLLQIGHGGGGIGMAILSFTAILLASINIFGGFTVTQRMLKMFRR